MWENNINFIQSTNIDLMYGRLFVLKGYRDDFLIIGFPSSNFIPPYFSTLNCVVCSDILTRHYYMLYVCDAQKQWVAFIVYFAICVLIINKILIQIKSKSINGYTLCVSPIYSTFLQPLSNNSVSIGQYCVLK